MAERRSPGRRTREVPPAGAAVLPRLADPGGGELWHVREQLAAQSQQIAALSAKLDTLLDAQQAVRADLTELESAVPRGEDDVRRSIDELRDALVARNVLPEEAPGYRQMLRGVRQLVRALVPRDSTLILVGKADDDLVRVHAGPVLRFPQATDGSYAGFYPACSTSAVVQLESLRSKGADFLLIPEPSRWWLEHYGDFNRHLGRLYRVIADQAGVGLVVSLRQPPAARSARHVLDEALDRFRAQWGRRPAILDWETGLNLASALPDHPVFSPPASGASLPYLDRSIDMVAIRTADPRALAEAERVAETAVISVRSEHGPDEAWSVAIEWKSKVGSARIPTASIVIPCFNGVAHTERCLTALRETLPETFDGELIVVDDASTDGTAECLARWSGIDQRLKVIRNRTNVGFLHSVNIGAEAATGEILVFLNNDTIPTSGWLSPLLRVLADDPGVGAVGGRLVYPDGRLQEAGSLVFRDGSAANFGRDDLNPDLPLYTFIRDVDYCSAALMATRRSLFRAAGGFDPYYEPGYYEDTDYCFKLREKGCRVVVQPQSVVIHVEGGTAGLDVSRGMKRYQVVNHEKFERRWRQALQHQPPRPARFDFAALHRLSIRLSPNGAGA
jgi:GT2 family glycosyltransferase